MTDMVYECWEDTDGSVLFFPVTERVANVRLLSRFAVCRYTLQATSPLEALVAHWRRQGWGTYVAPDLTTNVRDVKEELDLG